MPEKEPSSVARTALAEVEAEVRHILEEIAGLKEARAKDLTRLTYPSVMTDTDDYDHAGAALEARLAVAENRRATCLAEVRAEDAERETADLRGTNRRLIQAAEESSTAGNKAAEAARDQVHVAWIAVAISIIALLVALFKG